jgi:collagenase-like PrtC family protease
LEAIRAAVHCELQLIANASCLPNCCYEATHMQLLTKSSRSGDRLGGFCLDYCFLHCSGERLRESNNFLRACWIRPEDLHLYEQMGYHSFKLVERSSPPELMIRRVEAYNKRRFEGNLWELVAPIAQIGSHQQVSLRQRLRRARIMFRPGAVRLKSLLALQRYAEEAIPSDFTSATAPVYIDNRQLDGFAKGVMEQGCESRSCEQCSYCSRWAKRVVRIDPHYQQRLMQQADVLDRGMVDGTHWRL